MNDNIYKKSFDLFLKRTDEKFVVMKFIEDNFLINCETSFLDIGGGDGTLASMISKKTKTTTIVEPNIVFCKKLFKKKKFEIINDKWENVHLDTTFDFILVAYVVTYFPKRQIKSQIKKMYDVLNTNGKILILSIDAERGSWRKIHTYFYKLIGTKHESSDNNLKEIIKNYKTVSRVFKTHIVSKNKNEMLNILGFDFLKYPDYFIKLSSHLMKFLDKYSDIDGSVTLEMVHNAYIITKK